MNLTNNFIIAMPHLDDPIFSKSVVYICEHNNEGAMGIIINKPIYDLKVKEILHKLDVTIAKNVDEINNFALCGGPMTKDQGFILHTAQEGFIASNKINDEVMLTTSIDVLSAIGTALQPKKMMVTLGCAMWDNMQLETEIAQNDWLVIKADVDLLFDEDFDTKWQKVAQKLGVNINTISTVQGKA